MISFNALRGQFRLALTTLTNAPGFTTSVVTTMALTMATVFVVFSLVNTYFIKPLPVANESRLVTIEQQVHTPSGVHVGYQSYKAILHWYRDQSSLDKITPVNPNDIIYNNLPGEPKLIGTYAGAHYFDLLDAPVILGRTFDKNLRADQPVDEVVISEHIWQRYFDKDPDVLEKTLVAGERSFRIIGVIGESFSAPFMFYNGQSDVWIHFGNDRRFFNEGEWDNPWDNTYGSLKLLGERKPGMTEQAVFDDFDASIERIRAEWMEGYDSATDFEPIVTAYRTRELGDKGHLSLFLLASTLALLVIAVLNVCNLFISRALAEHKRLALQAVLGAKRKLLFMSIFCQTFLLMVASIAVGLFVAAWGIKLLKYIGDGRMPLIQSIAIDWYVLGFATLLSFALASLFAYVCSRMVDYDGLRGQLQTSGKNGSHQISSKTVKFLVGAQMLVASVLIIFAFMALTKTREALTIPINNKTENFYQVAAFIQNENDELSIMERFEKRNRVKAALEDLPQVKRVSIGRSPLRQNITASTLTDQDGVQTPFIAQQWVGKDYFDHVGLDIIRGRTFSDEALRDEKLELIITESLAKQLDPEGDVLGKLFNGHEDNLEIVGITEDFNHPEHFERFKGAHLFYPSQPFAYFYFIETYEGQTFSQEVLLSALREIDQRFKWWEFISMEEELSSILFMDHVTLYVSYALAAFTLILACVGIYGVISYNLGLRRFEFGIRMALGAKQQRLYKLLYKDAILPLFVGVVCAVILVTGICVLYADTLATWFSFELTLVIPALLISILIALVACVRPMQKIIASEPMRALRNE